MATLHVRGVPDELYEPIQRRARERRTSISKETILLLTQALRVDRPGIRELLDEIEATRPVVRRASPSAAALIREARERR